MKQGMQPAAETGDKVELRISQSTARRASNWAVFLYTPAQSTGVRFVKISYGKHPALVAL
jgi:hypothetical protein